MNLFIDISSNGFNKTSIEFGQAEKALPTQVLVAEETALLSTRALIYDWVIVLGLMGKALKIGKSWLLFPQALSFGPRH